MGLPPFILPFVVTCVQELRTGTTVAELREGHGKFLQDGGIQYRFGNLNVFFGGLESLIGPPEAKALQAMEREHTAAADSRDVFTTPDYGVSTTPQVEWWFVAEPERELEWPVETRSLDESTPSSSKRRKPLPLVDIDALLSKKNVELAKLGCQELLLWEEVIGARLYTGPMCECPPRLFAPALTGIAW